MADHLRDWRARPAGPREPALTGGASLYQIDLGGQAVAQALAAVEAFAAAQAPDAAPTLAVIVEELVCNLTDHGGLGPGDHAELVLERRPDGVRLLLGDGGAPFDPRLSPGCAAVPDRGGGAGLALVRAWSSIVAYSRIGDRNRLELLVPLPRGERVGNDPAGG